MRIWKLRVLDNDTPDWQLSTYKGDLIVCAEDEHQARMQATKEFAIASKAKPGQTTKHNPWSQTNIVACEPYSGTEFSVEGEPSILSKINI